MRLRAYGTDFYAVQLQKEREKHKSYLLPVPRVPPCRPEAAEKEVISAIISSCDNLLQLQVSGRHLTGHLDVNEREAADSLAESFEKILIEDGRCTVETDASAKDLHSVVQTAAYGATSPVQDGRVFELDSQQSYWSTFRTLEDAEAAVFEADPIQNLEESEFFDQSELQVQLRRSSPCSLLNIRQEVEVDEGVSVLRNLREKVGLDPGYLPDPLEPTKPGIVAACSLIIRMLEAEEERFKCPTIKSSLINADGFGSESSEEGVREMEPQELPDVALIEGSSMQKAGLGFLTKPFDDFASRLADRSVDTPSCLNEGDSQKSTWSGFVENRVLEKEETGLVEPVLSWDQVLAESSEGVQSREQGSDQPSLEALGEPALLHPFEFFEGLPSNIAKKGVRFCTKLSAVASKKEANGAFEEPTAESIENEFHRLVAHPELRMDSFNFNILQVPYLPCQGPGAETAAQIFSSSHARPRSLGGDSLYLDWHLAQSGACNQASCFQFKKKVKAELEPAPVSLEPQQPAASKASVLLAFLAAPEPDEADSSESARGKRLMEEEAREGEVVFQKESSAAGRGSERNIRQRSAFVSKTAGAMTEDLSFFMQARKGTVRGRVPEQEPASKKRKSAPEKDLGSGPAVESGEAAQAPNAPAVEVHTVDLSEEQEALLAALKSDYNAILVKEKSRLNGKVPGFGVDAAGNRELMALVKRAAASEGDPGDVDQQSLRLCATLWTLRQTASNLLEYGVRVAFLYLEHSLQTMPFMSMAVLRSKSALEAAYGRVEAGLAVDTPKLACLRNLLKTPVTSGGQQEKQGRKILILADRRAFISMYNELVAAGLRPFQLDRNESILKALTSGDAEAQEKLKRAVEEALTVSNCLLVSYGYLKASFPAKAFTAIVQFSDGRLSNADTDLKQIEELLGQATCPCHRIGVGGHGEETTVPKERVGVSTVQTHASRGQNQGVPPAPKSIPQPSTFPSTGRLDPLPASTHNQAPGPSAQNVQPSQSKPPDRGRRILIVANMLDSEIRIRRALYQSVVQLEKSARAQVVERDMALPVDLILHGATCLTIFTPERLGLDPLCLDDVKRLAALLPACFQDAVDSHLKAVSFAYKTAVLIFEGPPAFLRATYQELTPLHAAALGLDINLQCLLSDCPDTTNRFVLKLIDSVRTLPKRSASIPPETLPTMPETASALEAFLTAFPSLNPVSAHAILASGVNAPQFAQLPEEQQVALTRRFDVPVRSLRLFTLQFTVHCGRDPEGGARSEEALPYGSGAGYGGAGPAYEAGDYSECRPPSSYEYGERAAVTVHQPGQSNWQVPPDRYPQHRGPPSHLGHMPWGEAPEPYRGDHVMEADVSVPAYLEFPTAAEIEAAREPEPEWPSAREIAEQEADSPPLQERRFGHREQRHVPLSDVEERSYGRREQGRSLYSDGPEAFLQEDLYEGLPSIGQTDFDQVGPFEERSRFREGFGGGFGEARPRAGAPTGAATVEDPRDATRAGGAGDALESWLARKRKPERPQTRAFPLENLGQKRQRFAASPALGISTGLHFPREKNGPPAAGLINPSWAKAQANPRARSMNAPFGRVESAARGGTLSGKRGPGRSRSSGDSGGPGVADATSDERAESPELQEAIAHFRAYEYVPEAARKAAGGRTAEGTATHSAESDGGLSTPRPHLMDVPRDKRATEVLGYKRLGRDKQTRLSWGSTPSGRTSSREDGIPPRKIARAGSLATM